MAAEQADIEKKRKKRRRSARIYLSNAHPLPSPEQLAALVDQFPSDEDDDEPTPARARTRAMVKPDTGKRDYTQSERRRLAREGKAVVNPDGHISYPIETVDDLENAATLARTGHGDVAAARKLIARRARELGVRNPLEDQAVKGTMGNAHAPTGRDLSAARVSPSRVQGSASPSVGDHGANLPPGYQPGARELAWMHPDMRQGTVNPVPLLSMRTDANLWGARSLHGL